MSIALQNIRANEATRLAAAEVRLLVDYAPQAIAFIDLDSGNFVDPNENAATLFGISREEINNKIGPRAIKPEKQPDGSNSLKKRRKKSMRLLKRGRPYLNGYIVTHKAANFWRKFAWHIASITANDRVFTPPLPELFKHQQLEKQPVNTPCSRRAINQITQKIQSTTSIGASSGSPQSWGHALGTQTGVLFKIRR